MPSKDQPSTSPDALAARRDAETARRRQVVGETDRKADWGDLLDRVTQLENMLMADRERSAAAFLAVTARLERFEAAMDISAAAFQNAVRPRA